MRVLVLGSGVIGVTTAWYLSQAGHEVTVVDRQAGPALETSFANAAQISPGYSAPWAAPSIPVKAMKWLLMRHAPLIVRPRLDMAMVRWTVAMLRNCTHERYALNKSRMVRLAEYSRDQIDLLRRETGITYDGRQQGTLQLFRTEKQLADVHKDVDVLKAAGVPCEVLDRAGCIAAEPGLAASDVDFVGGLRLPHDETGDCFLFTNALAKLAAERGVVFHTGTEIQSITMTDGRATGALTSKGAMTADLVILALGSYSPMMAKPLGLDLPVYPVKGYSITAKIVNEDRAPVSTVMDESYKVAITRLGDRIRVGGLAEIAGYDLSLNPRRRETLAKSVTELFGGAGDPAKATFWTGLRPMTPDGTPIVGATPIPNLYLNTGHGTLGWTMSAGSGRLLADLISGRTPDIESEDLGYARYLRGAKARLNAWMKPVHA